MSEIILQDFKDKTERVAWSYDDRRKLLKFAGKMSIEDLAKELGRSLSAVKSKCHRQGIKYTFKGSV